MVYWLQRVQASGDCERYAWGDRPSGLIFTEELEIALGSGTKGYVVGRGGGASGGQYPTADRARRDRSSG